MTRHLVQLSGGAVSALAAERVVREHGTDDTMLLFADTLIEDEDLYRFNADVSALLGVPITRIADGRDPWQVFFDERMMGSSRVDPCSKILKRQLLDRWRDEHCDVRDTVVYVGISWDEGRIDRIRERLAPWRCEAPMCEPPYLTKHQMLDAVRALGLEPPRLYALGFPHNNCGGFCIKAGQAQFALLYREMPERYRYHEAKEQEFRTFLGRDDIAILRDRAGGTTKPLTLRAFRERLDAGGQCDLFDWGGCGCGVAS